MNKREQEIYQKGKFVGLMEAARVFREQHDETIYAKAALATVRKLNAYRFDYDLRKYYEYLVKTYHLEDK